MAPTMKVEKVTPAKAKRWLAEANVGNRRARPAVVAQYVADMQAGQWEFTADPIRFNGDNALIDGQHRLMAIEESGITLECVVVRGLDSSAKYVIDTGAKRKLADALHYEGVAYAVPVAACIRWMVAYERGAEGRATGVRDLRTTTLSVPEAMTWIAKHKGFELVVADVFGSSAKTYTGIRSALVGIKWENRKAAPGDVNAFIDQVWGGQGLHEGDPAYTLRRWLEWAYAHERRMRAPRTMQAVTVKAWNAYIEGRAITSLRFSPGGATPEAFPRITVGS